jgi:hypothetical protein
MPFSPRIAQLKGQRVNIRPEYGYGWALTDDCKLVEALAEVPSPFYASIVDLLFDGDIVRGLLGKVDVLISERRFGWVYLGARSDSIVSLENSVVGCNILLSDSPIYLVDGIKFPDPSQVRSESRLELRGLGVVSLEAQLEGLFK